MNIIKSNCATITLDGSETGIKFEGDYRYIWVENNSGSEIKISRSPNINDQEDGYVTRPSGSSFGMEVSNSTIYILGNGLTNVIGTNSDSNPFKVAGKGGDINPTPIGFDMTGIKARFDADNIDSENKIWTNSVIGGENLTFTDGSIVNKSLMIPGNNHGSFLSDNVPDVIYLVAKKNIPESNGAIFGQCGSSGHGNSIGLFGAQSTNVSFEVSIYNAPYLDIYTDPEKYHLFTFVETPENLSTLMLFTDGVFTGMLNNFNKSNYNGIMCLNGMMFTGNSALVYLCQQPAYFKHISTGELSQRSDWDFTEWQRVYNNMGWLMKNIVDPANREELK